jgi:hypothetical protein
VVAISRKRTSGCQASQYNVRTALVKMLHSGMTGGSSDPN